MTVLTETSELHVMQKYPKKFIKKVEQLNKYLLCNAKYWSIEYSYPYRENNKLNKIKRKYQIPILNVNNFSW